MSVCKLWRKKVLYHWAQVVELLPRDHESGQVGGVQGEEHHGEESPGGNVIKRYFSVADHGENKLERLSLVSFLWLCHYFLVRQDPAQKVFNLGRLPALKA
jgi:hypothetical protein